MKPPAYDPSEQHPYFPSGDWEGFYNDPHGRSQRGEMRMTLDFSTGKVSGRGSDPVGAYSWSGTYDTKAEVCQLTKRYAGAHAVEYSGYADENGIWGKWRIGNFRAGEFHIWPRKQDTREAGELVRGEVREAVAR